MADLKISQLTEATTPLADTEVLPIVQSSTTKKVSVADLTAGRAVNVASLTAGTGDVVIGTAGKGVNFSAAGGDILTTYDEGTWTPVQGAGVTAVGAFSSEGTYTRIGRVVVLRGKISGATSVEVAANSILCTGLPINSISAYSIGSLANSDLSVSGAVLVTTSTIYSTAVAATPNIYFTVTYQV